MKNISWCITFISLTLICCKQSNSDEVQGIATSDFQDFIENPMQSDGTIDSSKLAQITFEKTVHDFGTVNENDQLLHQFIFTNTGNVPLIISNANSTCGCTIPDWPKHPIPVGGKGEIEVKFNTTMRPNMQTKPVRIYANTLPNETIIYIRAFVKPKSEN